MVKGVEEWLLFILFLQNICSSRIYFTAHAGLLEPCPIPFVATFFCFQVIFLAWSPEYEANALTSLVDLLSAFLLRNFFSKTPGVFLFFDFCPIEWRQRHWASPIRRYSHFVLREGSRPSHALREQLVHLASQPDFPKRGQN